MLKLTGLEQQIELPGQVERCAAEADSSGLYSVCVKLTGEDSTRQLEAFVLGLDAEIKAGSQPPERRQLTIVVVDDSPAQRELASAPFIELGDTVHIGTNGLEGLALCLQHKPDIVLSDVQMPKMDGWQLLRMIKSRQQLASTPVIFLTTLSSEEDRLRGYRLGVDDYIAKPYASSTLVEHVERAVQRTKVGAHSWAHA